MSTATSHRAITRRRSIRGALELRGQEYPFQLHRQAVDLGTVGDGDYFYMQPSDLRGQDPSRDLSNFRSCIGFWWAAMHELGLQDDWEQQRHYVMAICYSLVNRNKSLQDVYLDAFPRPDSVDVVEASLPEEIQRRIRAVIDRREQVAVKEELDQALAAYRPSRGDQLGFEQAFGIWADQGVQAYRESRHEGVVRWLQRVDGWMRAYRKRCPPRVRAFINLFSYHTKCSFHLCYANFWASLIPWLQANHGLNELSTRLLQLWHNQNQPVEIPHGQTAGGLVYPTRGGVELSLPASTGRRTPHRWRWRTPPPQPEVVHDVFSGQVLALHPLTWFLFADPALRESVGLFLNTWEFDVVSRGKDTKDCVLYWEMIGAILTAAYMYRQARDQLANRRGAIEQSLEETPPVTGNASPPPVNTFLEDYLASRGIRCRCGGRFQCNDVEPPEEEDVQRDVEVRCGECERVTSVSVQEEDVGRFLLEEN